MVRAIGGSFRPVASLRVATATATAASAQKSPLREVLAGRRDVGADYWRGPAWPSEMSCQRDGVTATASSDSMTQCRDLIRQLDVQPIGASRFVGTLTAVPNGRAFGGQALGQALLAGARTAPDHEFPTSLHAYFIRAANSGQPATYDVETTRNGGRFAWRRVTVRQDEHIVLDALTCFQKSPPATFGCTLPVDLVGPCDLDSASAMVAAAGPDLEWFFLRHGELALEARYPTVPPPVRAARGDWTAQQDVWLRAALRRHTTHAERGAVLAFLSDVNLMATPLVALGRTGRLGDSTGATFEHQMRFHSALISVDDWLFYEQSTDVIVEGSIAASGRIVSRDGSVLVTVQQHGLAS